MLVITKWGFPWFPPSVVYSSLGKELKADCFKRLGWLQTKPHKMLQACAVTGSFLIFGDVQLASSLALDGWEMWWRSTWSCQRSSWFGSSVTTAVWKWMGKSCIYGTRPDSVWKQAGPSEGGDTAFQMHIILGCIVSLAILSCFSMSSVMCDSFKQAKE